MEMIKSMNEKIEKNDKEKIESTSFKKSTLREYAEAILVAFVLAFFIRTFVIQAFKIPSGSMEKNLLIGDHILVNKMVFAPVVKSYEKYFLPVKEIKRGDVIVFKYPNNPSIDYIKRVIALENETIEIRNKTVYINNKKLEEPYKYHFDSEYFAPVRDNLLPKKVPQGYYFVMGDNRDNSQDSRYWGFLARDHIKGRAFIIYWSEKADRAEYRLDKSFFENLKDILNTLIHFYSKTRWERTFKLIK